MPRTIPLLRVLTESHRADTAEISDLIPAAASETGTARIGEVTLRIAVQLVGEDVMVSPVVDQVLRRQDLRVSRRVDIRMLIDRLGRAAASRDVEDRTAQLRLARDSHEQLTSRAQVEVLPYLHYVFDEDEQARLAQLHPDLFLRTAEQYRSEHPESAPWRDNDLLDRLTGGFREQLQRVGPPRIRSDWSGPTVTSHRRREDHPT